MKRAILAPVGLVALVAVAFVVLSGSPPVTEGSNGPGPCGLPGVGDRSSRVRS